jgi:hypothetical protein
MKLRKNILALTCAAAIAAMYVPLAANAEVGIFLNIAPPPSRHEAIPAPRSGYVWSSGYWNAKGHKHVWQAGHWERQRNGYHFTQPTWTQRDDRWQLERGRWNKGDRDGDGVPNSRDRKPDNPNRS